MSTVSDKLIKDATFDIIAITSMWSLAIASQINLNQYEFYNPDNENKKGISIFRNATQLLALGTSVFVMARYFHT